MRIIHITYTATPNPVCVILIYTYALPVKRGCERDGVGGLCTYLYLLYLRRPGESYPYKNIS
jgi:hypothetical protein